MSDNGHWVAKCVGCGAVVAQCRCLNPDKKIEKAACGECRGKWITLKPVENVDELTAFLTAKYPDENFSEN